MLGKSRTLSFGLSLEQRNGRCTLYNTLCSRLVSTILTHPLYASLIMSKLKVKKGGAACPTVQLQSSFARATKSLPGHLSLDSSINEVYLLHHTPSHQALPIILDQGFNERFAGSNCGTLYGAGSYFAEDVAKTDQYAMCDREWNDDPPSKTCTASSMSKATHIQGTCSTC
jgi:hypothetical protein